MHRSPCSNRIVPQKFVSNARENTNSLKMFSTGVRFRIFPHPYINRGTFFEECECRSIPHRSSSFMAKYCIQNSGAQRLQMLRMAFGLWPILLAISVHQTPQKTALYG